MTETRFTVVHRSTDPFEMELLHDFLTHNGVPNRLLGTRHGAGIGVAQHILKLKIEVSEEQKEHAKLLIEAFISETEQQPDESIPELQDDEERQPGEPTRRPLLAAGIALFFPGASHLHARRPWTALLILLSVTAALAVLLLTERFLIQQAALFGAIGLVLFDSIGGALASRICSTSGTSMQRQLVAGFAAIVILLSGAYAGAGLVPTRLFYPQHWHLSADNRLTYQIDADSPAVDHSRQMTHERRYRLNLLDLFRAR